MPSTLSLNPVPVVSADSVTRSIARAPSNGPAVLVQKSTRSPSKSGYLIAPGSPFAESVAPRTSAQPATLPSAALVIRLTVPPRNQMIACARIVLHKSRFVVVVLWVTRVIPDPATYCAVCLTVRDCEQAD